jgi:hypothetical protein
MVGEHRLDSLVEAAVDKQLQQGGRKHSKFDGLIEPRSHVQHSKRRRTGSDSDYLIKENANIQHLQSWREGSRIQWLVELVVKTQLGRCERTAVVPVGTARTAG